ncbi:MAG: hypothetical protein QOJ03_3422 [Frankiaceae bacterium]|nr:hypothetical protein [Frankiaceae bacterium]
MPTGRVTRGRGDTACQFSLTRSPFDAPLLGYGAATSGREG